MKKINVGIIGLGHMGLLHMMNSFHIDNVNVVAVADKSKLALKKAKSYGVNNLYKDYRELINKSKNIDAAIISLPNFLHYSSTKLALEKGLDIFIEKPMANSLKEGYDIYKYAKKYGKKLMIGHCMRFLDSIEKMKDAVTEGLLGDIEVLTLEMVINGPFSHPAVPKRVPEWWFDPKKVGGGALHDIGYHLFDLFRFFAGDAELMFSHLDYKYNLPVEDCAIVILRSRNSSIKGIINVGWYQKTIFPRYNFRAIIHGNAGYLSSDELAPKNIYFHAIKEGIKNVFKKIIRKKITPLSYSYYYESYYKELDAFYRCVINDAETPVTAKDGVEALKLINDAYNMSKNGGNIGIG